MTGEAESGVPPLLPFPPLSVQSQLPPEEWQACLGIWIAGVTFRLRFSEDELSKAEIKSTTLPFLQSYLTHRTSPAEIANVAEESKLSLLCCFLVKKYLLAKQSQLSGNEYFELLSSSCRAYGQSASWKRTLKSCWSSNQIQVRKAIEAAKSSLTASAGLPSKQISWLQKISALTKALHDTATVTVAGADYVDTLTEFFEAANADVRKAITENIYYSFIALLENKHIMILTDNIYHMKSEADRLAKKSPNSATLLSSLLCTTTFLKHFSSNTEAATRKRVLLDQLSAYRQSMLHLHPLPLKPRLRKGKEISRHQDHMHMHKAAHVSQVHELFPNLSSGYILKALDHYSDNVENVIAALLEPDTLPAELQNPASIDAAHVAQKDPVDLAPRVTPPLAPGRVSKPDDLDFDKLKIDSKQLRRGKKDISIHDPVTKAEQAKSKAAIMSALAAFDSDDDERDDTYDVADIGGAVDNTLDTDERRKPDIEAQEASLYRSWKENPELFARDSKTRSSNIRQQLKRETGMSDEQIEGWAIMLNKDKKLQDRLQEKYSSVRAFGGQQRALQSTKWQANASIEDTENESGPERSNDTGRMGQAGIRGHRNIGRGRGRGGGSTAGPSEDPATQAARRRKEQGRGRGGANHRRDARAKMGRGMGPIPPT